MKKQLIACALLVSCFAFMSCNSDTNKPEETAVETTTTTNNNQANSQQVNEVPVAPSMPVTAVEVLEPVHDFGKVKEGVKLNHSFKIKNVGDQPFLISDAKPSCGCTVPSFSKKPVLPGEFATIDIEFDTKGRVGNNTKDVTVVSNAKQEVKLSFKAEVTQ